MNQKPLKEKVSVSLDEDILEKCRRLAQDDDRSLSQYINLVLRRWIIDKEKRNKKDT